MVCFFLSKEGNFTVITNLDSIGIVTSINEPKYGKFYFQPLEKRIATIVGNSLRRVLLSSLPGASVYYVKIDGVLHEFSTIPGVEEDVTQIVLNLKKLRFRVFSDRNKVLYLSVKGVGQVTAADIQADSEIEILNPSLHIASLSEKDATLSMEIGVTTGTRYICADKYTDLEGQMNVIPIDSYFSPVETVCYNIDKMEDSIHHILAIELWTDGSLLPNEALSRGAKILSDYLNHFIGLKAGLEKVQKADSVQAQGTMPPLDMKVEDLNLSVRALNCLKRAGVETLGELIQEKESELMSIRNFGRKSMTEVIDKLKEFGLTLRPEDD
jgi:DNA-directed RNA polymerase subunit alpha